MCSRAAGWSPLALFLLLLLSTVQPLLPMSLEQRPEDSREHVIINEDNWSANGATKTNLNLSQTGKPVLERPNPSWTTVNGLPMGRTGVAGVAIPQRDEVWFIGGREDPNPTQNGDEVTTSAVEIYDIGNDTWEPGEDIALGQQYAGAEVIGNLVLVAGDWYPTNSNPIKNSGGMLQIHNLDNNTWYKGPDMPSGKKVGNAGVAALGGYLYVVGGVTKNTGMDPSNRTLRYDPVYDEWLELSPMNASRWGLTLTAHDGLLYAIGGAKKTSSSSWIPPVVYDNVEVYDPVNDSWWELPDMPTGLFGHESVVLHDEILIISGYSTSRSEKVWGFEPESGRWRKLTDLPTKLLDLAAGVLDETVVIGSGDQSSYLYYSWGTVYSGEVFMSGNISTAEGWLNSAFIDLRPGQQFTCRPIRLGVNATTPVGTFVESQVRAHILAASLSSSQWEGVDGTIASWFDEGENWLSTGNANHLQYRVRLSTTDMLNWTIPELAEVTIEADHVGFHVPPPAVVHALSAPMNITTGHHISNGSSKDTLWIATTIGGQPSDVRVNLSRDPASGELSINDPHGLLLPGSTVSLDSQQEGGINLTWSVVLADGINSDYLRFGAISEGSDDMEHVLDDLIRLDEDLKVELAEVEAHWTGQQTWLDLSQGGTVPAGAEIRALLRPFFPSTDINHSGIDIEARLNLRLRMEAPEGSVGWWNSSTDWMGLDEVRQHSLTLDGQLNGTLFISVEARSALTYNLSSGFDDIQIVVDDSGPLLISSIPLNNSYIDSMSERNASIMLWETGGLDLDSIVLLTWVEGRDDGHNGSPLDGLAQPLEMKPVNFNSHQTGYVWYLNYSLNDSSNIDHGTVEVWISGQDVVGHNFPDNGEGTPYIRWETRDAKTSVLESIVANGTIVADKGLRLEPGIVAGWNIILSDANDLYDIQMVELRLGDETSLGVRWLSAGGGCNALDERIIAESVSCTSTYGQDFLTIDISFAPTWRINPHTILPGALDVMVTDIDGTVLFSLEGQMWHLTTDLVLSNLSLRDVSGPVSGEIIDGHIIALGDDIIISASIRHGDSGNDMEGLVTVRWNGIIHGEIWSGEQAVELLGGKFSTELLDPPRAGRGQVSIEILDEMGWQSLATIGPIELTFDAEDPILLSPANHSAPSRYHLNSIVITASVTDDGDFNRSLTAHCQVRAEGVTWPVSTVVAPPVGVFADRSVYSFHFNMSALGKPSDLPILADLACWAEGTDASGRSIIAQTSGNSLEQPWLILELTSLGPNLQMTYFTSDRTTGSSGDRFRVSLLVNNLGEAVDQPLILNITITSPDGEQSIAWTETRNRGMAEEGIWSLTIDIWPEHPGDWLFTATIDPDDHVAELREDDNSLSIEVSISATSQGFFSNLANPTSYSALGIILLLALGTILYKGRKQKPQLYKGRKQEPQHEPGVEEPEMELSEDEEAKLQVVEQAALPKR